MRNILSIIFISLFMLKFIDYYIFNIQIDNGYKQVVSCRKTKTCSENFEFILNDQHIRKIKMCYFKTPRFFIVLTKNENNYSKFVECIIKESNYGKQRTSK